MATIATMALLKPAARIVARSAPPSTSGSSATAVGAKAPSVSLRAAMRGPQAAASPAAAALAGAFFSALAASPNAAIAAEAAAAGGGGGDNRGQLLLFVVAPAIGWVLYNILQPALNQLNRMRSQAVVAGLGGLGAAGAMACAPEASAAATAQDLAALAAAAADAAPADDNRGLLLLIVVAPAIGWVLFNILQPALNQLNRMRSD